MSVSCHLQESNGNCWRKLGGWAWTDTGNLIFATHQRKMQLQHQDAVGISFHEKYDKIGRFYHFQQAVAQKNATWPPIFSTRPAFAPFQVLKSAEKKIPWPFRFFAIGKWKKRSKKAIFNNISHFHTRKTLPVTLKAQNTKSQITSRLLHRFSWEWYHSLRCATLVNLIPAARAHAHARPRNLNFTKFHPVARWPPKNRKSRRNCTARP